MAPWWNQECQDSVRDKLKSLHRFRANRTLHNYLVYKKHRGKCKSVIKKAKRLSWRTFCTSFNKYSNLGTVWKVLKSMDGQSVKDRASIPPLIHNNQKYLFNLNKANILGQAFQKVSSSVKKGLKS